MCLVNNYSMFLVEWIEYLLLLRILFTYDTMDKIVHIIRMEGCSFMQRMIGTYTYEGHTIEYSICGETGEPILVMHGGHSNCYEEFGYKSLIKNGFRMITPSRAGYGKTSKELGESLAKACQFYVRLLDYLHIEKVHILSISAGGPSGLYFAAHYPERVKTLALQSAVTKEWHTPQDSIYKIAQVLFHPLSEKITWRLTAGISNLFPSFIFKQMVPSFSKRSYKEIKENFTDKDINEVRKMNNRQQSGSGFLIDLDQTKEITSEDLLIISCPTLIMHSKYDGAVSLEHVTHAQQHIPSSKLCLLDSWGHLLWIGDGAEEASQTLVDFLMHPTK